MAGTCRADPLSDPCHCLSRVRTPCSMKQPAVMYGADACAGCAHIGRTHISHDSPTCDSLKLRHTRLLPLRTATALYVAVRFQHCRTALLRRAVSYAGTNCIDSSSAYDLTALVSGLPLRRMHVPVEGAKLWCRGTARRHRRTRMSRSSRRRPARSRCCPCSRGSASCSPTRTSCPSSPPGALSLHLFPPLPTPNNTRLTSRGHGRTAMCTVYN